MSVSRRVSIRVATHATWHSIRVATHATWHSPVGASPPPCALPPPSPASPRGSPHPQHPASPAPASYLRPAPAPASPARPCQSINQSINQPTNQAINQSINQPINPALARAFPARPCHHTRPKPSALKRVKASSSSAAAHQQIAYSRRISLELSKRDFGLTPAEAESSVRPQLRRSLRFDPS